MAYSSNNARLFQLDHDLVDPAVELERRLVGEVDRRAGLLADVEAFTDRVLHRHRSSELGLAGLAAIDRERDGGRLAELA